jgi:hypothetical protein
VRILLVRHREESPKGPVFFTAHSGGDGRTPWLVSSPLSGPEVLLDLDLPALAEGEPGPGTPSAGPIYLVCTHGRHDICCADHGRPLYRALSEARPEDTWEVSHIGGDRFAGNMLVLPRGDYFGRLEPEEGVLVAEEYEAGKLDLAHHRGRSSQPRLVQAAEHFLRESEALLGFDDLVVQGYRRSSHDRAEVIFLRPAGASYRVQVAAHDLPDAVYLTCRAEEPGRPMAYELVSLSRSDK